MAVIYVTVHPHVASASWVPVYSIRHGFFLELFILARVTFFIDGFNVYHSLQVYDPQSKTLPYRKYLRLDFLELAQHFTRKQDILAEVYYFTAYATWKRHSMKRHRVLIDALRNRGVRVVMGRFKDKHAYCKKCGASFITKEEKQTDVNIAVYLFKEALANSFDTAVIVTNDTDLVPAIHWLKQCFPDKKVGVLFPIDRSAVELTNVCHFWRKIEKKHLKKCQFPDSVTLPSGIVLSRPPEWK
jgi:uncharacterized LabA/DUF88 family protein